MTEDYVKTLTLRQEEVDAAIKGQDQHVNAVAMQVASQGAELASLRHTLDKVESQQGMGETQVSLMYAQVNKVAASIGMLRAELAGARKFHDDMQLDILAVVTSMHNRVTWFCTVVAISLVLLAIAHG